MAGQLGRGPYDQAIIAGFASHISAEEVAASEPINGILSPAECLDRLQKIVQSRDILDANMLAKLNLEDAYFLRNKLRAQLEKAEHIDKDSAATWIKAIDSIQTRVEKSTKGFEDSMIRMQQMHATIMAQAIQVSYAQVAVRLQQEFGIEASVAYKLLEDALPLAIESLDGEVSDR